MFRSLFFATTAAMLAGLLVGCGSKPLPPAEAIAFADRCDPRFDEQIVKGASVFKRVTLEGTLDIPRGMFVVCRDTCEVSLHGQPDRSDPPFTMFVTVGEGENQASEYPETYSDADLKVHAVGGKTLGVGARVRVTGSRLGSKEDGVCALTHIEKIEAI